MIIAMILPIVFMLIIFALFIWQAVWVAIDSRKRGEEYWWLMDYCSNNSFSNWINSLCNCNKK